MKKINLFTSAILTVAVLLFTSCSSIVNGSKQDVSIRATPADAKIYVNGELTGTGATTIKLARGKSHVVEVKHDGYRTSRITTDKSLTGWFWGNLICGGIPGGAVDLITGAAYDIDPNNIVVTLEQGTGSIEIPGGNNFGLIEVNSPTGERLASLTVQWE